MTFYKIKSYAKVNISLKVLRISNYLQLIHIKDRVNNEIKDEKKANL